MSEAYLFSPKREKRRKRERREWKIASYFRQNSEEEKEGKERKKEIWIVFFPIQFCFSPSSSFSYLRKKGKEIAPETERKEKGDCNYNNRGEEIHRSAQN